MLILDVAGQLRGKKMALLFVPWDPWLINKRKWQKGIIKIEKLGWFGLGGEGGEKIQR